MEKMSSWGYVHQRDASLNSYTTFDDDLGWDAFEGTNSDGIVPEGTHPQEIRKGKRSARRPPPSKNATGEQRTDRSKSNLTEEWDSMRPPSLSPPLSMGNASNSGLVPSILDEGFEGSCAVTDGGGVLKVDEELGMDTSSFAGLDNMAGNDVGGLAPGKRLSGSMDFGYEGLGDMDIWFKGPDTSAVPWETSARNFLPKSDCKVEDPDELVAQVLNEDTPSPERGDFESGKSTLTSDESHSNLYQFQKGGRDWGNSAAVGAEGFQQETGGVDLKPNLGGGLLSTDQKEKIQLRLNAEKDIVKRQIHQQLVKQQQEREEQHRLQQEQEQQLIRRQEVERQFLYMQVQKQQQHAAQALGSPRVGLSVPEASQEDLEKIALELSAAEPRPYPDASSLPLDVAMSAPSTSGSEEPAMAQDDASIKRARRQAVARRLEQTGKRVPKSPSFSNLSSKGSYSPQQSFQAPPPPSPVALPGGALKRSPPPELAAPPSIRPPPLVLPPDPAIFPAPSGGGPSPLIPTPQNGNSHPPGSYMPVKYVRQQPGLPPGPPAFGQAMYYSPQMGGAQPTYLSPPGAGQMGWGGGAMVDPSLQVPPEDDSTEANVFRELEGAMRNLDVSMRLTLRDSLFRLADSASHRAVSSAAASASGSTADTNQSGSSTPGGNANVTQAEKVTQMIDRAVANLLYHKQIPAKPEEMPAPPPQSQFLVGGSQQAYGAFPNMGGTHQQVAPPAMLSPLGGVQTTVMPPPPPREWYWHDTGQGGSQMVSNAQLALPPRTNQSANRPQKSAKPSFASRYKRGKASQKPPPKVQLSTAGTPDAKASCGLPKASDTPVAKKAEQLLASGGAGLLPRAGAGKGQKHEGGGERDFQGSPKLARSAETGRSGVSSISVKDEKRALPGLYGALQKR